MRLTDCAIAPLAALTMSLAVPSAASHAMETPGLRMLPHDSAVCAAEAHRPAALMHITGFKDRAGLLRIQSYTDNQSELLEKGKYLNRMIVPVTPAGDMMVCMPLPKPGKFVLFVVHDRDSNYSVGFSDGAAFSNNPKLRFSIPKPPKPKAQDAAFEVLDSAVHLPIRLNYLSGFSIRPIEPAQTPAQTAEKTKTR
jgi:uncharacterized protein (DUF2141 family)